MPGSFFDSNVLLYTASVDTAKAETAKSRLRAGGTISVQVLNEVANVARRKMAMTWPEVHDLLAVFRGILQVRPLTLAVHDLGLDLAVRYRLSLYDAMILASALEADCDVVYSEDMHGGMRIDDRLTIINPFA